ncbi:MAG TPA: hypothetical protein VIH03_08910 [Nitrososphaerales archaeon]
MNGLAGETGGNNVSDIARHLANLASYNDLFLNAMARKHLQEEFIAKSR